MARRKKSKDTNLVVSFASDEVNESEEYCLIETTAEPGLTHVRLYEETVGHVKAHHGHQFPPELPSMISAVGGTVKEPTWTEPSYNQSVVFVNEKTTNRSGHPFRVSVQKITGTTSGYVTTFFFAPTEREEDDDDGEGDE